MSSSAEEDPIPSVKDLASSEPSLRRRNLNTILSHLKSRSTPLTPTQSQQLWRAFSVALMLHDSKSALSVQSLISTSCETFRTMYERDIDLLANLIESKPGNAQEPAVDFVNLTIWHTAFWTVISREWSSLDQWRMNKFLLLIRLAIRAIFDIFIAEDEHLQLLLSSQISIMTEQPLSPNNRQVPDGLRLHVLDVWLDELQRTDDSAALKRKATTEDDGDEDEAEDNDEKGQGSDAKISRKDSKRQKQHPRAEEDGAEDEEWAGFDDDAPDTTGPTDTAKKPDKSSPADVIYSSTSNGTAYAALNDTASNTANTTKTTEETPTLPPISSALNQNSKAPSTTLTAPSIENYASLSRSQISHSLMQPIRNLAKDGLSRSVRTKAKDVIKTYDEFGTE